MSDDPPGFSSPFYAGITRDNVFDFIREKGIGGSCPSCDKDEYHPLFTVNTEFIPHIVTRDEQRPHMISTPSIACFLIMCGNCGYVSSHALTAVTRWLAERRVR